MRVGVCALLALVAGCGHHAPPPTTSAAPTAPAAYADTTAAWAGLHHRADSTTAIATAPSKPDTAAQKPDTASQWMAANLAIGDGVFIVRARYGGMVYVGAGNATQTATMQLDAGAIDDFVGEVRDWLPPRKPRKDAPPPVVQESKSGRAISFGRRIYGGQAHYRFFFADDRGGGFSLPATLTETRAMLAGLARGAALAREAQPRQQSGQRAP